MKKTKNIFSCDKCGYQSLKWLGRCPECNSFGTITEEVREIGTKSNREIKNIEVYTLDNIKEDDEKRISTHIQELDRVLNGGIVKGSLTLVGGDPGIGKSTLLLQISETIGNQNKKVLYISGEESKQQIKLRASRLNIKTQNLYLGTETNITKIEHLINQVMPDLLIIDSVQTMYSENSTSMPGSVTQVKETTNYFMKIAKIEQISVILIGHVTKDGAIAGPKVLEHMVDTVLYSEGDKKETYRIIRSVKNRFGSTNEIGIFEMREKGLFEISNPSEYMLSGRPLEVSGSCVTCSLEGTRPLLVEVQALVSNSNFGIARRITTGMDYNRVSMLIAVLEKRLNYNLTNFDSYVNIAGGIKIVEPSLDCAVITSIASSFKNVAIDPYTLVFGEIGLTGEIRAVTMAEKRVLEAKKLGFKKCIMPYANLKGLNININKEEMQIFGVQNIKELLSIVINF